jgi:MFS family permease
MSATRTSEFRGRGWQIVLASLLGIGLGLSPMPWYTMGVFAPALSKEFGWRIDQIMFGLTITTLMVLWAGPLVGLLAKRWGARPVALCSVILFSLSFMALGLNQGSLTQFYLTFAAVAILGAGTLPITWTRAVNGWFDRQRGLALGLSLMGTGIFGFFSKGLTAALIAHFGWRGAYVGLGMLPLLIAAPAAYFLFHEETPASDDGTPRPQPGGMSVGATLADWRFWLMGAGFFLISLALGGIGPNLEKILTAGGMGLSTVLRLTALVGLSALAGRVIGGFMVDRYWAPVVAFFILAMPALSCWLLAHAVLTPAIAAGSILLIGFALGVEYDLMAFLLARYFGLRNYTVSYGILYVFFSCGAGFGPLLYARAYVAQGSYAPALRVTAVALIAVAASFLLLGRYREFDAPKP